MKFDLKKWLLLSTGAFAILIGKNSSDAHASTVTVKTGDTTWQL